MTFVWLQGGETGSLMRAHDWSASPLGPPQAWPLALRSVVSLMLGSKFPMFVAWGPKLALLYNDAYAEILGAKHPAALGAPFQQVWAEIWPDIWPLAERALAGEAIYQEDLPLLMNRRGFDEQTWFTFSYSPVRNEAGKVAGMFCAVVETTQRVRAEQRRALLLGLDERLNEEEEAGGILTASVEILGPHLNVDRAFWAVYDPRTDRVVVRREWTKPGFPSGIGSRPLSEYGADFLRNMREGRAVAVEDVMATPIAHPEKVTERFGMLRGALVIPCFRKGVWQAGLCFHTGQPRRWRDEEVELARDAAEQVWMRAQRAIAEVEVRHSEQRFRSLVNAISDVVYEMDPDWFVRQIDRRGAGAKVEGPLSVWLDRYIPAEDQPAVRAEIARATAQKDMYQIEHRVRRANGSIGWNLTRAIPVLNPVGHITQWFGMATDVTERRQSEEHMRLLINELNHRVKNTLATVQAIAAQTLRDGAVPVTVRQALTARLIALAEAHDVLTQERWSGADLGDLIVQAAAPYIRLKGGSAFDVAGPAVFLPPKTAIALALAFHELATNAAKYGALSTPGGRVGINWSLVEADHDRRLSLTWRETGGPPVEPPQRAGFGTRMIQHGLAAELRGEVTLDFRPEGLVCVMQALLPAEPGEARPADLKTP